MNENSGRLFWATSLALAIVAVTVTGCKFLSGPPTAIERKFFDFETNQVSTVITRTNTVLQTNTVTISVTNEQNVIVPKIIEQVVPIPHVIDLTNWHEEVTWRPNTNTAAIAQTGGAIGNLVAPGTGGLITGALGMFAALYAKLRSTKKTGGVLVENIAAILQFAGGIPGGDKYVLAIKQYLMKHQSEANVMNNVVDLIRDNVDDPNAKANAEKIRQIIASFSAPPATGG